MKQVRAAVPARAAREREAAPGSSRRGATGPIASGARAAAARRRGGEAASGVCREGAPAGRGAPCWGGLWLSVTCEPVRGRPARDSNPAGARRVKVVLCGGVAPFSQWWRFLWRSCGCVDEHRKRAEIASWRLHPTLNLSPGGPCYASAQPTPCDCAARRA